MKTDYPQLHTTRATQCLRPGITVLDLLCSLVLFAFPMTSQATEEPTYKVVQTLEEIEIRAYDTYAVAEVVVPGPAADAGNQAFPILAGYIFGKNKGERKFAMTAPVTQAVEPVKLEMTAPVTQTATPGGFRVQFVLPQGVTMASAPEPIDSRIMLRDIPPSRVAVIRFSGFWTDNNYNEHLNKLQLALRSFNLVSVGDPIYSRYNAPFTPWFLRRNEIWLQLAQTP